MSRSSFSFRLGDRAKTLRGICFATSIVPRITRRNSPASCVGTGVGSATMPGVGAGVTSVVGPGVGAGVGSAVGPGVGAGVGSAVGAGFEQEIIQGPVPYMYARPGRSRDGWVKGLDRGPALRSANRLGQR